MCVFFSVAHREKPKSKKKNELQEQEKIKRACPYSTITGTKYNESGMGSRGRGRVDQTFDTHE